MWSLCDETDQMKLLWGRRSDHPINAPHTRPLSFNDNFLSQPDPSPFPRFLSLLKSWLMFKELNKRNVQYRVGMAIIISSFHIVTKAKNEPFLVFLHYKPRFGQNKKFKVNILCSLNSLKHWLLWSLIIKQYMSVCFHRLQVVKALKYFTRKTNLKCKYVLCARPPK